MRTEISSAAFQLQEPAEKHSAPKTTKHFTDEPELGVLFMSDC